MIYFQLLWYIIVICYSHPCVCGGCFCGAIFYKDFEILRIRIKFSKIQPSFWNLCKQSSQMISTATQCGWLTRFPKEANAFQGTLVLLLRKVATLFQPDTTDRHRVILIPRAANERIWVFRAVKRSSFAPVLTANWTQLYRLQGTGFRRGTPRSIFLQEFYRAR